MKPYSLDLRERVVARVVSGEPVRSVAAAFDVSVSSVVKWSQRWRATGSAAARPMGGKRRDVMAPARDFVLARLAEEPSLALRALQAELAEHSIRVSYGALWRFVHREGLSFKKRRSSPPRSSVRTSRAAATAGSTTSSGSTRPASSSSTRPG
jgi:transposase